MNLSPIVGGPGPGRRQTLEAKPPADTVLLQSGGQDSFWDRRRYNSAFHESNSENVKLQNTAEMLQKRMRTQSMPPLSRADLKAARPPATTQRRFDGFDSSRDLVGLYASEGQADQPYRIDLEVAHLRRAAEQAGLDSTLSLSFGNRRLLLHIDDDKAVLAQDEAARPLEDIAQAHHSDTFNRIQVAVDKRQLRALGWQDGQPLKLEAFTHIEGQSEVFTRLGASSDGKPEDQNIFRWEGKVVYYAVTDRFHNGDKTNDVNVNKDDPEAFHGGDWQGVIDKLDYLKDLNVDCIWLSPPYLSERGFTGLPGETPRPPKDGFHGYWPMDFSKPEPSYGDDAKLEELTQKAHAMGMKVMLDVVPNHTAYGHEWVKDPAKADWFHHQDNIRSYNQYEQEHGTLCGLPDLAQENPEVTEHLIEAHKRWLDLGVDAFRVDAARHVPEKFLRDFNSSMRDSKPGYYAVGEVYDQKAPLVAGYQNRTMDATFDFPLAYAIRNVFTSDPSRTLSKRFKLFREMLFQQPQEAIRLFLHSHKNDTMESLSGIFAQDSLYDNPNKLGTLIDNHDMIRFMSDTGGRPECLTLATAFLMAVRGTPHVYFGTEIGAEGIGNANRKDMEFGKNPELTEKFKALTSARAASPALQLGNQVELGATESTYALSRMLADEEVVCVFNNADEPQSVSFRLNEESQIPRGAQLQSMLDDKTATVDADGMLRVEMPAKGYAFLRWSRPNAA